MLVRIDDTEEDRTDDDRDDDYYGPADKNWSWEILERMTQESLERRFMNWRVIMNGDEQPWYDILNP